MKRLTSILVLAAVAVLINFATAQQGQRRGASGVSQPSTQLIAQLDGPPNPAAINRVTNEAGAPVVPKATAAKKNCTCVASRVGWNKDIVYNYGVIEQYDLFDVKAPGKCSKACSDKVSGKVSIEDATALCARLNWSGGCIRGYGYIGALGTNNADGTAGLLSCTAPVAAVTKQKCPAGWACNGCSPQVDGGITSDGKCKKLACQANTITPYPPDGTQIGSWGFSWDNAFYAWGTAANGGKPTTITVSPAIPGSGSWGTCP